MHRSTRFVTEVKCRNCGIVQLLGQTFNGKRCCENPRTSIILGEREIVEYTKTDDEERQEIINRL